MPRGEQILPTEVANVAAFLSSDVSSAINATEVFADGGNHGFQERKRRCKPTGTTCRPTLGSVSYPTWSTLSVA